MRIDEFVPQTFRATSGAFTPGATPQDVFTITGNSTTNVYVQKMGISTTQTTAGLNAWYVAKRSTANSGGTSSAATVVPLNANYSAHATVLEYTGNPTAGTLIGNVWGAWVDSPAVAAAGVGNVIVEVDFQSMLGQPLALLSTADVLAWNFNGAALPGGLSVIAYVQWVEYSKT